MNGPKGDWDVKFDETKTRKGDFHVSSGTVQCDMMFAELWNYGILEVEDLNATALQVPYKGNQMSMILLKPNDNLGSLLEAMAKVTDLNSCLKFGEKVEVQVTLPRFKIESQLELVEPLKQLGLTDMFDGTKANFSGKLIVKCDLLDLWNSQSLFENSATVCSFENIPSGECLFESYISFTSHVLTFLFRSLSMEQTTAEFRPEFKSQK